MLEELKESLVNAPIVKKGNYDYFVHPISDGVPTMKPEVLKEISKLIVKNFNIDVDKIVAIEAMGIHLATALSLETDIPFVIIRKRKYGLDGEKTIHKKTGYGESTLYVNDLHKGDRILLIDDVVSTGGTLINTIEALKEIGVDLVTIIAVLEKGEGKKIVEKETGCKVNTVVKIHIENDKVVVDGVVGEDY
ncbi:MAG: hypoxanthine/guanine phosphoribosyltransferase [Methanobrevibacter boviskoreani]|jgi:adenine phosphoribosyltransferase|uniref:hypoxanthine/guanine phosphoribosyltransferase n=1 Tax=Methanobrevibacter TaxID=2172 RepID=UPI0003348719|nr:MULTISPECIES: hypoxanthine/guanine phosphoribosyltransferase [Methanobrevibacter]AGN17512.1 adenine phosphoribosyltransferase Apt [Methanobrevibacter sp. AbM4]MCI6930290.1 hypoxanthine/guanine phosphoribosyltransferase [Methanobrevibacter boviskoreani]MDY5614944.1 hypoxanthine/guanine phosphoribosyltransferase [Methanobrevibacter boviskoreani]